MSVKDFLLAILCILLWSSNFIAIKHILNNNFPLFYWLFLRFIVCATLLLPFCGKSPVSLWKVFLIGTIFSICQSAFRFKGLEYGVSIASMIVFDKLSAVFSLLLGIFIFRDRIGVRAFIGLVLAISGTYYLSIPYLNSEDSGTKIGLLLAMCSAFSWSIISVCIKNINTKRHAALLAWICLMGSIVPGLLSCVLEFNHVDCLYNASNSVLFAVLFTAVGPLLCSNLIWYYLLNKYEFSRVVPLSMLEPLVGSVIAYFVLHEVITIRMAMGFAVVFSGIVLIVLRVHSNAPKAY